MLSRCGRGYRASPALPRGRRAPEGDPCRKHPGTLSGVLRAVREYRERVVHPPRPAQHGPGGGGGVRPGGLVGMGGFLLGATGMFATMYSTQAILPQLGRAFHVSAASTGLTISATVAAVAIGAWLWGPWSDRHGRRPAIILASALLVLPTVGVALVPSFPLLLACRAAQGLCMPGLLTVGVPYVVEAFGPRLGGRAMGYYVVALVVGGLIGRVGVALLAGPFGWRVGLGVLAVLPALGAGTMLRSLPDVTALRGAGVTRGARMRQLASRRLLQASAGGAALLFSFIGLFSYIAYRLEAPPFGLGAEIGSLIFLLWVLGAIGPVAGRWVDRWGWRRVALACLATVLGGIVLSLPETLPAVALGMALVALGMFAGVTAMQVGVAHAATFDRGLASSFYFSCYYTAGAVGGFLPGLAWEAWGWVGVAAVSGAAILAAAGVLGLGRRDGGGGASVTAAAGSA